MTAAGTGVLLYNEMDDFSAKPGVPNAYGLIGGDANAGNYYLPDDLGGQTGTFVDMTSTGATPRT